MSRHLSTHNISSKFIHAFLCNLANRQTKNEHGQKHVPPPLSEVKKELVLVFTVRLSLQLVRDAKQGTNDVNSPWT